MEPGMARGKLQKMRTVASTTVADAESMAREYCDTVALNSQGVTSGYKT